MSETKRSFLLASVLAVALVMTSYAADTKIDKVTVTFSYETAPKSGDTIGSVTAKTTSQYFTVDSAEYENDQETWSVGDRPLVRVELTAKDGYRFSYTSSGHFSLSGGTPTFKKAKIYDSGASMVLEVYLKRVGGRLGDVERVEWSGSKATWERMDGAKSYDVRLYRNEKSVTTVSVSGTSYDFSGYFDEEGTYTFRVRAIASYNDTAGEWSDDSDDYEVDEEEADRRQTGNRWVHSRRGWWYAYEGGGHPSSCWEYINNRWYYFDRDGYMLTGWQKIGNRWYYLNPDGAMLTGWQKINNRWYYLDGSGVMLTGWQLISGRWYYLDGSGTMLTGWQSVNSRWYYLEGSGEMLTGWRYINGRWYYLNSSGVMLTDWQDINGRWYYLGGNGAMLTGWQYLGGRWYYLESSGAMLTGWQLIGGRWYYLEGSGAMLTGWQFIGGRWYYLDQNGAMYANTTTPDGHYVNGSGAMVY